MCIRDSTRQVQSELPNGQWQRVWHGFKLEALYSILYHGKLLASSCKERGERFLDGLPGVYVHKDETVAKAGNYMRFVPLLQ